MGSFLAAGTPHLETFSLATLHNSEASSTPVTLANPYSAAMMQARPRPQPRSTKANDFGRFSIWSNLRKPQAFTGPYAVALSSLEGSKEVSESSIWPLVRTPYL